MLLLTISVIKLFQIVVCTLSSSGTHFLVAAPKIISSPNQEQRIQFFMSTQMPRSINVLISTPMFLKGDAPGMSLNYETVLKKRVIKSYEIERRFISQTGFGKKWSYRLNGTGIFALYVIVLKGRDSIATFQALPVEFWGKKYIAVTLWVYPSLQIISSAENNSIHTFVNISGGKIPMLTYNSKNFTGGVLDFVLNLWEAFSISYCEQSFEISLTLTGSIIEGEAPIGVISGNCDAVTTTTNCKNDTRYIAGVSYDMVAEMLLPLEAMGTEFISIATKHRRTNGLLMIVAGEKNTEVNVSLDTGERVQTIRFKEEGEFTLDFVTSINRKLVSNNRIHVALVMMSACIHFRTTESHGDPSLGLIVPNILFYVEYMWNPPMMISDNFVVVVVEKSQADFIYLDHSPLATRVQWEEVAGDSKFKVGTVSVSIQNHSIASTHYLKFGCYLYGLGRELQYMHPAGYEGCIQTIELMFAGDGVDNDCDDYVDEEPPDGKDNDNDKKIDEDTYGAQGSPGNWGSWSMWTCNLDCKQMVLMRIRQCNNPPPSGGGRDCMGPKKDLGSASCLADIVCRVDCHNFTWGEKCERSCINCKDECNALTGVCSFCKSGFKHPAGGCDKPCDVNEYGQECQKSCVEKCGTDCIDRDTGECPNEKSFQLLWLLWFLVLPLVVVMHCLRRKTIAVQNETERMPRASLKSFFSQYSK